MDDLAKRWPRLVQHVRLRLKSQNTSNFNTIDVIDSEDRLVTGKSTSKDDEIHTVKSNERFGVNSATSTRTRDAATQTEPFPVREPQATEMPASGDRSQTTLISRFIIKGSRTLRHTLPNFFTREEEAQTPKAIGTVQEPKTRRLQHPAIGAPNHSSVARKREICKSEYHNLHPSQYLEATEKSLELAEAHIRVRDFQDKAGRRGGRRTLTAAELARWREQREKAFNMARLVGFEI